MHSGSFTHETFCLGDHLRCVGHIGCGRTKRLRRAQERDEVKIQANAVPSYTLEIVSKEEADKHDVAMVVGSCENGTKAIIYQKNND